MVLKANKNKNSEESGQNEVVQTNQTAVTTQGKTSDITELNPYLEGLEGIGESNRVGIDGTEFEFKQSESRVKELNIVVSTGRKVFQYWDENKTLCQSFDGKVSTDQLVCATCDHKKSKDCKFKFEIRWLSLNEETEEPEEFIMTLPTVSAINFVNYIKKLAKEKGLGVHEVVTNMKIERRVNTSNNSKYSVVNFENVGNLEEVPF